VIPIGEVDNGKATHLGDGQAWKCELKADKFPSPSECWIFRRIHSRVPQGVIEIVAGQGLVHASQLRNLDPVLIDILAAP
jgi:hypothetical protein